MLRRFATDGITDVCRFAYDVIGRVLYGQSFGFLETNSDVGKWMVSVSSSLPLLTFAAVAPSYLRILVMLGGLLVPGMFKSVIAVFDITKEAKRATEARMNDSDDENSKRNDIMSQLVRVLREKGAQIGFTHKEITLESWVGM